MLAIRAPPNPLQARRKKLKPACKVDRGKR